MESIRELYKIGRGPSSSHTMGPFKAAKQFREQYPDADAFRVTLYGSLALTGKGHMTDKVIAEALGEGITEIVFDKTTPTPVHPNTMDMTAIRNGKELGHSRIYSIGGGSILSEGQERSATETKTVYPHRTFTEIAEYCAERAYVSPTTWRRWREAKYTTTSPISGWQWRTASAEEYARGASLREDFTLPERLRTFIIRDI